MKRFVVVLLGRLLFYQEASANNLSLEATIQKVLAGFQKQDAHELNTLIHPETGIYVVYKIGVPYIYAQVSELDFNAPVPGYLPYPSLSLQTLRANQKVTRYGQLPKYNCDTEEWHLKGLSVGKFGQQNNLLSYTAEFAKKYDDFEISDKKIAELKNLESKSRRVILASKNTDELVFHLSLIKGRWYLTLLDLVSNDCSA